MISFRPATLEDFEAFFGRSPPQTLRAVVAERDGKVIGIGGYYFDGGVAVAFTDHRSGMLNKREIVLCGRKMMEHLNRLKVDIVAQCGPAGDTALRHYGFRPWGMMYRLER